MFQLARHSYSWTRGPSVQRENTNTHAQQAFRSYVKDVRAQNIIGRCEFHNRVRSPYIKPLYPTQFRKLGKQTKKIGTCGKSRFHHFPQLYERKKSKPTANAGLAEKLEYTRWYSGAARYLSSQKKVRASRIHTQNTYQHSNTVKRSKKRDHGWPKTQTMEIWSFKTSQEDNTYKKLIVVAPLKRNTTHDTRVCVRPNRTRIICETNWKSATSKSRMPAIFIIITYNYNKN